MKRAAVAVLLLATLAAAGWYWREPLLLRVAGIVLNIQRPVEPNRAVAWQQGPAEASTPPGERPPNIVLIVADDLGWNDITLHGGVAGGGVPTPAIDSLARDGVAFDTGYAGNAVCAPSRAMILTGRYSTRAGFEFTPTPGNMLQMVARIQNRGDPLHRTYFDAARAKTLPPMDEQGLPGSEVTLAELLRERGYHTLHIGKWHLGQTSTTRPTAQGFDESLLMASGLYLPGDDPGVVNAKLPFDPIDRFLWAVMRHAVSYNDGPWFGPDGYLTDYFTQEAVRAIGANRNRPFFLYLAHWGVHSPLQAARADWEALSHIQDPTERVYAAMVRALDRGVAGVLKALEDNGLDRNTVVLFTSDNGAPGYIGLPRVNEPYRGWKLTLFEGGIRVPWLLRWPAGVPVGSRVGQPVSHLDILPTLAAAAGAPLPADRAIDGVDLLPWARGERRDERPHAALFWREGHYRAVRAGDWKLQVSTRPDRVWLHDLGRDPTERREVSAEHPDVVARLRALLDAHDAEQREPLFPAVIEAPVAVDKTLKEPLQPGDEYIYWPG